MVDLNQTGKRCHAAVASARSSGGRRLTAPRFCLVLSCMVALTNPTVLIAAKQKTIAITKVEIKDYYDARLSRQVAAEAVVDAGYGEFPDHPIKSGKAIVLNWFSTRGDKDVVFYTKFNRLDDFSDCFAMSREDGSLKYVGCAPATSSTIYRIDRGRTKIPWLRVRRNGNLVNYCWNGREYEEKSTAGMCY